MAKLTHHLAVRLATLVIVVALALASTPLMAGADVDDDTVTMRGVLVASMAEGGDDPDAVYWSLDTGTASYALEGDQSLEPGTPVAVTGERDGSTIDPERVQQVPPSSVPPAAIASAAAPPTAGAPSVLVIRAYYGATPPTASQFEEAAIKDEFRNNINPYFLHTSNFRFSFAEPVVTPWLQISTPVYIPATAKKAEACTHDTISDEALAAARTAQSDPNTYDPDTYDYVQILMPYTSACPWGGLGNVSGKITWVNLYEDGLPPRDYVRIVVHEFGHNLGLGHSNVLACGSVSLTENAPDGCTNLEYDDPLSAMNKFNTVGVFAANQLAALGWLDAGEGGYRTVTSTDFVELHPLECNTCDGRYRAIKLMDGTRELWLEYRQPILADSFLAFLAPLTNGLIIHRGYTSSGVTSQLIAAVPGVSFPLRVGDVFQPPGTNWIIEVERRVGCFIDVFLNSCGVVPADPVLHVRLTELDSAGPPLSLAVPNAQGQNGWYPQTSLTVEATTDVADATAPVCADSVDDGPAVALSAGVLENNKYRFVFRGDGTHEIECRVRDIWHNETVDTLTVKVDSTDPSLSVATSPASNGGWVNADTTVTWSCTDDTSGVASVSSPTVVNSDGETTVSGQCRDLAGNSVTADELVRLDSIAPALTVTPSEEHNDDGWWNHDVTFTWHCTDNGSTVASAPSPTVLSDGANQTISGSCVDQAGNTTTVQRAGIQIDSVLPTLTVATRTPPTSGVWNNGPVTVVWNCTDGLSTIKAGPEAVTVTTEGKDQGATATCTDFAGNTASSTLRAISIDTTAPVVTRTSRTPDNEFDWNNGDVVVTWQCGDNLSLPVTSSVSSTVSTEGEDQSTTGTCRDNAGNTGSATETGINIDRTAPGIAFGHRTLPNEFGWNKGNVTVTWVCSDDLSDVVATTVSSTVSAEGADQSASGQCIDHAGNTASASQSGINIDRTAPTGVITTPAEGARFTFGDVVAAAYSCDDQVGLSGVASCEGTVANGQPVDTGSLGDRIFTLAVQDRAGNTRTTSSLYRVMGRTSLDAGPALLQTVLGIPTVGVLSARLTGDPIGAAVAGRTVRFSVNGRTLCTAVTDADGVAACSALTALVEIILADGYQADFAGDDSYLPSGDAGPVQTVRLSVRIR